MAITQADINNWMASIPGQVGGYLGFTNGDFPQPTVHLIPADEWASESARFGQGDSAASFTSGNNIYIPDNIGGREAMGRLVYETVHVEQAFGPGGADTTSGGKLVTDKLAAIDEAQAEAIRVKMGFAPTSDLSPLAQQFYNATPQQNYNAIVTLRNGDVSGWTKLGDEFKNVEGFVNNLFGGGTASGSTVPGGYKPPSFGSLSGTTTSTGPSAATQAALKAAWQNMLTQYGVKPDAAVNALIDKMSTAGDSTNAFLNAFYQTQQFHNAFPGILNANGTLKMSLSSYVTQKKDYQDLATAAGVDLKPGEIPYLFRNNVSPTEFKMRTAAEAQLQQNPALFAAFNKQLQTEGQNPLNKADQYKFLFGMGNQSWTKTWNDANSRYGGNQAGITFNGPPQHAGRGEYTNVGRAVVDYVAGKGLSPGEEQQGYQKLAQQLTTTLPLSRIQKFGLTKQDLVELEFGGKRQASVAQTVQTILKNESNIEDQSNKVQGIAGIQPGATNQGSQQALAQS